MSDRSFFGICILFLAVLAPAAWAGDAATFVDLGFSPDGKNYMFAQYGVESATLKPWSELFVVDVPKNNFVSGGRVSYVHTGPVTPGQDGSGAFYTLLTGNAALAKSHRIDFTRQSQPLYISLDNGPLEEGKSETVEFRDFDTGSTYAATLVPYVEGAGADLKSSFYINLVRTAADGTVKKYVVGTPQVKRPQIIAYRIRRAMIAPKDGSLIFVVEMRRRSPGGFDLRYMVEALRL